MRERAPKPAHPAAHPPERKRPPGATGWPFAFQRPRSELGLTEVLAMTYEESGRRAVTDSISAPHTHPQARRRKQRLRSETLLPQPRVVTATGRADAHGDADATSVYPWLVDWNLFGSLTAEQMFDLLCSPSRLLPNWMAISPSFCGSNGWRRSIRPLASGGRDDRANWYQFEFAPEPGHVAAIARPHRGHARRSPKPHSRLPAAVSDTNYLPAA